MILGGWVEVWVGWRMERDGSNSGHCYFCRFSATTDRRPTMVASWLVGRSVGHIVGQKNFFFLHPLRMDEKLFAIIWT